MSEETNKPIEVKGSTPVTVRPPYLKFGIAITVIIGALAYLAALGISEGKSYYVTIKELHTMGKTAYHRNLRVAGIVQPGSIKMNGPNAEFMLVEDNNELNIHEKVRVVYKGSEPPPDTFKDNAQALAIGGYQEDGVFHAKELQAKCASKYAPQPGAAPAQPAAAQPAKGY